MLNCAYNVLYRMHNLHVAYIQRMSNLCLTYKNVQNCGTSSRIENLSLTYAAYTNVLAEFRIRWC